MTFADKVGTAVYFRNLGQGYSEMFRGSMTASGFVTAGAAWLGMSKTHAVLLGVASLGFWVVLAVFFGWAVWKWKVIHAQLERERDNSPVPLEMLQLLRAIRDNTQPTGVTWRPNRKYDRIEQRV
jgi:hypothetical protein